jgi:hypothetical protein
MKLLIAVGETPKSDVPPPGVAAIIEAATEIQVTSPAMVGPLKWLAGETDKARRVANDRLGEMLRRIDDTDAEVSVADLGHEPPSIALAEALGDFDADHVLIVADSGDTRWRRRRVLDELLDREGLVFTVVVA